jgi:hypothetical protein
MGDELEIIWKEAAVAQSRYYPGIWVEGITQPFDAIYEQFSY